MKLASVFSLNDSRGEATLHSEPRTWFPALIHQVFGWTIVVQYDFALAKRHTVQAY